RVRMLSAFVGQGIPMLRKVYRLALLGGGFLSAAAPAAAQSDQLLQATDIVPNGRIGVYAHGTYPSEGDRTHAGVDIPAPCKTSGVLAWREGVIIDLIDSKKTGISKVSVSC
nr:hypothetical protein [Hyphomonas sp.]